MVAKEQTQMSEKDTIRTLQLIDTTLLKCYIKVGENEARWRGGDGGEGGVGPEGQLCSV